MTGTNSCGDCDLCCRLLAIEPLGKPPGALCTHYLGACAIYDDRPGDCRGFHCQWLKSQRLPEPHRMGAPWRPDRAHLMVYAERSGRRLNVAVDPDHPDAWRAEPYYSHFKRLSQRVTEGFELVVLVGERRFVVFPQADIDLGAVDPDSRIELGFVEADGQTVPYARVLTP